MKQFSSKNKKGFSLVELLVVMAIMAIMMSMAASVLKDSGTGRGIESGVDMLQSVVEEARATAMGNDVPTRVVIICDPSDQSPDSIHLRHMIVEMRVREEGAKGTYDGTDVAPNWRWKSLSNKTLPPNVYFCPEYSKALGWKGRGSGDLIYKDNYRLRSRGQISAYCIEFDEKGRLVGLNTSPGNQPVDQRLVLINGRLSSPRDPRALEAVVPTSTDSRKRPIGARGIIVAPNGEVSLLRNDEQVFDD